jgi:ABC-type sugar transport system ATPase subunit
MRVEFQGISKRFGTVTAVHDLDLVVQDGEFVALLGPSGCGKTTTLLMASGIYEPSAGDILFDGRRVNQLAPRERDIGMVFQSYALYPHMTAFQNIVFSLVLKKTPKSIIREEAERIAGMLGIAELLDRKPAQLSGGQQQRVALGRALIKKPGLLLFDEPLSNLDARLRVSMRAEIKRLQHELGITSLYVTHDQVEAMTMADRIAVMKNGVLQAYATASDLHDRPATKFIAEFIGNPPMNFMPVELRSDSGARHALVADGVRFSLAPGRSPNDGNRQVVMGIRPEDVKLDSGIETEVVLVEPMGRDDLVLCTIGGHEVGLLADPGSKVAIGDRVQVAFDMEKAHFFDPDTDGSLLWN